MIIVDRPIGVIFWNPYDNSWTIDHTYNDINYNRVYYMLYNKIFESIQDKNSFIEKYSDNMIMKHIKNEYMLRYYIINNKRSEVDIELFNSGACTWYDGVADNTKLIYNHPIFGRVLATFNINSLKDYVIESKTIDFNNFGVYNTSKQHFRIDNPFKKEFKISENDEIFKFLIKQFKKDNEELING